MNFHSSKLGFSVSTSLSDTEGSSFPCGLDSLLNLRRVVDFQFAQFFFFFAFSYNDGMMTSKLLTGWTRNWKSVRSVLFEVSMVTPSSGV